MGRPWRGQRLAQHVPVALELLDPPRLLAQQASAAIAAATAGGGSAVEKISVRAVLIRYFASVRSQQT